jgi:hypothetical protein
VALAAVEATLVNALGKLANALDNPAADVGSVNVSAEICDCNDEMPPLIGFDDAPVIAEVIAELTPTPAPLNIPWAAIITVGVIATINSLLLLFNSQKHHRPRL